MGKVKLALSLACLAGIGTIIAGLISEARPVTIMWRGFVSFTTLGLSSFLLMYLYDFANTTQKVELSADTQTADEAKPTDKSAEKPPKKAESEPSAPTEPPNEVETNDAQTAENNFKPLEGDELKRVQVEQPQ